MQVHPIRIEFEVTPEIRRFVYIYLIEGERLYLVDAGVAGSEGIVCEYLEKLGRRVEELDGLFLTHSHPDHIGAAAALKRLSGCTVYACAGEKEWIEDIERQFTERPIPNFHRLLHESVRIDRLVEDGDAIACEEGVTLKVIGSPGHSAQSLSFLLCESGDLFTGDAVPVPGDIPIYVSASQSMETLRRLGDLGGISHFYSAWDEPHDAAGGKAAVGQALARMEQIDEVVSEVVAGHPGLEFDALYPFICEALGAPQLAGIMPFKNSMRFHVAEIRGGTMS